MCPPIQQCPSGHPVCSSCSVKLSRCPTCRAKNLKIRNLSLEKLASDHKIKLPCTFEPHGCKQEFFYTELSQHQSVCEHRPLPCPHAEHPALFVDGRREHGSGSKPPSACKWKGKEEDLLSHLRSAHGATVAPLRRCQLQREHSDAPKEGQQKGKGKEVEAPCRAGAAYCLDSILAADLCTKTHTRYLQVLSLSLSLSPPFLSLSLSHSSSLRLALTHAHTPTLTRHLQVHEPGAAQPVTFALEVTSRVKLSMKNTENLY